MAFVRHVRPHGREPSGFVGHESQSPRLGTQQAGKAGAVPPLTAIRPQPEGLVPANKFGPHNPPSWNVAAGELQSA